MEPSPRLVPTFPRGGSTLHERVRWHAWSGTALGDPATWSLSLRNTVSLMLDTRQPMCLAWGPELVFLYNDAYAPLLGARDAWALGRRFQDVWSDIWAAIVPMVESALAGQATWSEDFPLVMQRHGYPEETWWSFSYSPLRDDDGTVAGMLNTCTDTSAKVLAERTHAFSDALERELLGIDDPEKIQVVACHALGRHLAVNRVGYSRMLDDDVTIVHETCHADGVRPIVGEHRIDDFGDENVARLRHGRTEVCDDVTLDPVQNAALWARVDTRAFVSVPLIREGRLRGTLYVNTREARHWSTHEIALIQEVAHRTWEATERAHAERRIIDESDRLKRMFEQAPTFMAMLSGPDHRFAFVNPGYRKLVGSRDLIGRTMVEALPDAVEQGYADMLDSVYASGEAYVAHASRYGMQLTPGGPVQERFIDFVLQPLTDAGGAVVGIFVDGVDVTDRTLAEAALRALNVDLERQVMERAQARGRTWQLTPDLMGALNAEGYFETSNPAWHAILGWSEAEIEATAIFDLLHPDDLERSKRGFDLTLQGRPALKFENRCRCRDGSYRWISWVGIPEDGLVYCIGHDITDDKRREAELQLTQESLRQSQKMEAVGQLTGGLAHDFNNLLTGISGSLELLQLRLEQGRTGEAERYVQTAQSAAKRAAALTHRLLAFSRRQTLAPKATDVKRMVEGMDDLLVRTVGPSILVEIRNADDLWPSMIDPSQLENALLNLCINARDAMPDGGTLTIETINRTLDPREADERGVAPGDYLVLAVTDTGTGMTPEVIAKAFDPFFTTKPIGMGTGLGLSMVYGFAKQSNGMARIVSQPGRGAEVSILLPRHEGEAAAATFTPVVDTPRATAGETVLAVDDEPTVRMLVSDVLDGLGYSAIEAHDGPSGLRVLDSNVRIDLLITDVGLPGGLNGRQVADAARVTRPDLKVLFITGYAETAVLNHGHLEPGMHVLTKPFEMETLAGRVRDLVAGRPAAASPTTPA